MRSLSDAVGVSRTAGTDSHARRGPRAHPRAVRGGSDAGGLCGGRSAWRPHLVLALLESTVRASQAESLKPREERPQSTHADHNIFTHKTSRDVG
eukprot:scaffold10_cov257-Pinguiococcus_pyrenoidosus.AAC.53